MPRGDRTGPEGMGPMTGRAAGFCSGNNAPGYPAGGFGRGAGRGAGRRFGRGLGFGWGRGAGRGPWGPRAGYGYPGGYAPGYEPGYVPPTEEEEAAGLRREAEYLDQQLKGIQSRLEEIEKKGTDTPS